MAMDKPILREYQRRQLGETMTVLHELDSVLYQSPTGSGKGYTMGYIFHQCQKNNKRVWFIVHGRLVLDSFCDELHDIGIPYSRLQAGKSYDGSKKALVVSVDTLSSRYFSERSSKSPEDLPIPDYILVDECRKIVSPSKAKALLWYRDQGTKIIGFDATPQAKGLGKIYQAMTRGQSTPWHIHNGDLVPITHYAPNQNDTHFIDEVKALRVNGQEYNQTDLTALAESTVLIGNVVKQYEKISQEEYGEYVTFVVACTNKSHAKSVLSAFIEADHAVEYIDGDTPQDEREAIKGRVESGETIGVISVLVMIYGVNWKSLTIAILARPVRSIPVLLQFGGRVLRTYPGKSHATFIDMGNAIHDIGYIDDVYEWDLDGGAAVNATRKEREEETSVEHVDITCSGCSYVYKNAAQCPKCGTQNVIANGETGVVYYNKELIKQQKEEEAIWGQSIKDANFRSMMKGYVMSQKGLSDNERLIKFNYLHMKKFDCVLTPDQVRKEVVAKDDNGDIKKYDTYLNIRKSFYNKKRKRY